MPLNHNLTLKPFNCTFKKVLTLELFAYILYKEDFQPLQKCYHYLFVMPPWASPVFTIFSHQPLQKYYHYLFVMPPWVSLLFTIFSHQPLKKSLHRTKTILIRYLNTDQIILIHPIVPRNALLNSFS